jgi:hypothetical protein
MSPVTRSVPRPIPKSELVSIGNSSISCMFAGFNVWKNLFLKKLDAECLDGLQANDNSVLEVVVGLLREQNLAHESFRSEVLRPAQPTGVLGAPTSPTDHGHSAPRICGPGPPHPDPCRSMFSPGQVFAELAALRSFSSESSDAANNRLDAIEA